MLQENKTILSSERKWISKVSSNLLNIELLSEYADWLSFDAPKRSEFLRQFIVALKTQSAKDLPSVNDENTEWLEVIGFDFGEKMLKMGCFSHKENFIKLARPALRMQEQAIDDQEITIGMSKIGGQPDMPIGVDWPIGNDCTIQYDEDRDIKGEERLAGFLGQLNFSEIEYLCVSTKFPKSGLLSFFCFQDMENGDPEYMGIRAYYFPENSLLERRNSPNELTEGNLEIPAKILNLIETIDIPERGSDSPWDEDYEAIKIDYEDFFDYCRDLNFSNVFGYGRSTTGGDPTKSKEYQNLIILETQGESRLHIQITKKDLENSLFENIELVWVDYD
jgi:uncharacterized protein YwqG